MDDPSPMVPKSKTSMGTWIVCAFLVALLIAAVVGFTATFPLGQFPKITMHGWIAMGVGTVFSLLIGCGLMWLSFYSSRHGFDERADPGRLSSHKDSTKS
jgi:cation transporter-like permease